MLVGESETPKMTGRVPNAGPAPDRDTEGAAAAAGDPRGTGSAYSGPAADQEGQGVPRPGASGSRPGDQQPRECTGAFQQVRVLLSSLPEAFHVDGHVWAFLGYESGEG